MPVECGAYGVPQLLDEELLDSLLLPGREIHERAVRRAGGADEG
jgi:hypothetical protein